MTFLPKEYKAPKTKSRYTKWLEGDNRVRVMSDAITGFEYWTKDSKPVRLREEVEERPENIQVDEKGNSRLKEFWAFIIWNYGTKQIEICEITQSGIMGFIKKHLNDPDWGDIKDYDIVINRVGLDLSTVYSEIAKPKTEVTKEIQNAYDKESINLEALFDGEDPFSTPNPAQDNTGAPKEDVRLDEIPL